MMLGDYRGLCQDVQVRDVVVEFTVRLVEVFFVEAAPLPLPRACSLVSVCSLFRLGRGGTKIIVKR